jgi:tripeptide aminopeptidase
LTASAPAQPLASDQRRLAGLAADPGVHRAFHWLHIHELQLRRWQLEFLAIPAPPFAEAARAAWFCDRFRELGLVHPHIDAEGNAVALLPAPTCEPAGGALLLSAHLDTVFPAGTDCTPDLRDGRIHGPGACDNGAGLAALLATAAAIQHAGLRPPCPVLFSANVGEEGEGDLRGMRALFRQPPFSAQIRAAIALEGAGEGLVVDRALGSRRLRASVTGPGGHSWADASRPNPILALSAALLAIARLPLPSNPRTTLNVGTLHGGTSVNAVPETASADLDLRSTSELELDRLELSVLTRISAEIEAETRQHPEDLRLQLRIERTGQRAVGVLGPDAPLLRSLRAVDRHLGITTEPRIGSTDANLPLSLGIPALAIGSGGTGAGLHTLAEWYDPTGRETALRRILLFLLDTCTQVSNS